MTSEIETLTFQSGMEERRAYAYNRVAHEGNEEYPGMRILQAVPNASISEPDKESIRQRLYTERRIRLA